MASLRVVSLLILGNISLTWSRVAFEKLTGLDYGGTTYYKAANLSMYECQDLCRQEPDCRAVSFSFAVNTSTAVQETVCQLLNETSANNPAASPKRRINLYYMVKLQLQSDNVCLRPWTFERVPNKIIVGLLDVYSYFASTKDDCLGICLNEHQFTCRSVGYSYKTSQCGLINSDRRTTGESIELVDDQEFDYFENLCLKRYEACKSSNMNFQVPRIGVDVDKVAQYVSLQYYVDKELQVTSESACRIACEIENKFLCRSFLYKGAPIGTSYNCQLFHLDHKTLPDGPCTYLKANKPLINNGERVGTYFENYCEKSVPSELPVSFENTKDPTVNKLNRTDVNCNKTGTCYDDKTVTILEPYLTKTSVLALGVTCALLILIYISTMFCYCMKKWQRCPY